MNHSSRSMARKPAIAASFAPVTVLILTALLSGCATSEGAAENGRGGAFGKGKPAWIAEYPTDPDFYIGIGSSNTGNQAADMESARAKAQTSLAAAISTTIQSEQKLTATGSSTGPGSETVELVIQETVNQNLSNIEVVDSYYSAKDGYWFYLRLNKEEWRRIQEAEMRKLVERIEGILGPALGNPNESAAVRIAAIVQASSVAGGSPYSASVSVRAAGETGAPIDLLKKLYRTYVESLSVTCAPAAVKYEEGTMVTLDLRVASGKAAKAGAYQLLILGPSGETLHTVQTDETGRYKGDFTFPSLPMGRSDVSVVIDTAAIKSPLEPEISGPVARVSVEKSAMKVGFTFQADDQYVGADARGSAKALIAKILPAKLVEGNEPASYTIQFSIFFRDAPDNAYGMFINYAKAIGSVLQEGKPIWTYESQEIKTGGLNISQARATALKKLMETLDLDTNLREGLLAAISRR